MRFLAGLASWLALGAWLVALPLAPRPPRCEGAFPLTVSELVCEPRLAVTTWCLAAAGIAALAREAGAQSRILFVGYAASWAALLFLDWCSRPLPHCVALLCAVAFGIAAMRCMSHEAPATRGVVGASVSAAAALLSMAGLCAAMRVGPDPLVYVLEACAVLAAHVPSWATVLVVRPSAWAASPRG